MHYAQGTSVRYLLNTRLGGAHNGSEYNGYAQTALPRRESKSDFLFILPAAQSLYELIYLLTLPTYQR